MNYVILAGGIGTRIWPMSRKLFAKQFLPLVNGESLFQNTIRQIPDLTASSLYVITNEDSKFIVQDQLRSLFPDFDPEHILVEPVSRNTCAAMTLALHFLDPKTPALFISADHSFSSQEQLITALKKASEKALQGNIILIGTEPKKPQTNYGWIKSGVSLENSIFKVDYFKEKPGQKDVENFFRDGGYFWNSGLTIALPPVLLHSIKKHQTEIYTEINSIIQSGSLKKELYEKIPEVSFEKGVLEKENNLIVVNGSFEWNDLYNFESLYELSAKDDKNNAIIHSEEKSINIDTSGCMIYGNDRIIATLQLKNLAIIDTKDALFISPINATDQISQVVEILGKKKAQELEVHTTAYRPWGSYTVLQEGSNYKVKELHIRPGKKISLQYHKHRSETWTVVQGVGEVTKGNEIIQLNVTESVFIPAYTNHRLYNPSMDQDLKIIEVQTGDYLGEDDIIRIDDEFARK